VAPQASCLGRPHRADDVCRGFTQSFWTRPTEDNPTSTRQDVLNGAVSTVNQLSMLRTLSDKAEYLRTNSFSSYLRDHKHTTPQLRNIVFLSILVLSLLPSVIKVTMPSVEYCSIVSVSVSPMLSFTHPQSQYIQ
jgi:hypothetical protein